MNAPRSTLEINAPEQMYTVAERRIDHLIAAHEWAIIKHGDGNKLIDYALVALGSGLGFLQNIYQVWLWASRGTPLTGWDVVASVLCGIFFASAVSLYLAARKFKSVYQQTISEIDGRQPQRFHPE